MMNLTTGTHFRDFGSDHSYFVIACASHTVNPVEMALKGQFPTWDTVGRSTHDRNALHVI